MGSTNAPREDTFSSRAIASLTPRNAARRIVYALAPTPVRCYFFHEPWPTYKVTRTSWLDGFRGLAALVVINFHHVWSYSFLAMLGFRTPGKPDSNLYLIALPPFGALFDGSSAVGVFFGASGYVCSIRAMQLMQSQSYGLLMKSLASSTFRRGFRLYLPAGAIMLIAAIIAGCRGFYLTEEMFSGEHRLNWLKAASSERNLPIFNTWTEQLMFCWKEFLGLMNVWNVDAYHPRHDSHLWTVPYEYRMSMHVYFALLATARCKPNIRILTFCLLAGLYIYFHRWESPLFFLGAAGAQVDVLRQEREKERSETERLPTSTPGEEKRGEKDLERVAEPPPTAVSRNVFSFSRTSPMRVLGYALGFYFCAYPTDGYRSPAPGYAWMNQYIPGWYAEKAPKTVGVALIMWHLLTRPRGPKGEVSGFWHNLLESRFAQYLGQHMYSLYLVHGTIFHLGSFAIPWWIWGFIGGNDTMFKWLLGWVVGYILTLMLCLWLAELFHREIEVRCIMVARWLEQKCFVSDRA